jgi:phosphohistidine phosphatase
VRTTGADARVSRGRFGSDSLPNVRVILVRHGDADAEIPDGLEDEARALTARSRLSLPVHFAPLAARIGLPTLIYMSPLVRAVQTATLLAQALRYEGPLKANRVLFPNGPVGAIEALLAERKAETVVLVGHQPSMGSTAAHFLGLGAFPKPVQPGTVIGIERPDDALAAGKLLFYAAPGQPVSELIVTAEAG